MLIISNTNLNFCRDYFGGPAKVLASPACKRRLVKGKMVTVS